MHQNHQSVKDYNIDDIFVAPLCNYFICLVVHKTPCSHYFHPLNSTAKTIISRSYAQWWSYALQNTLMTPKYLNTLSHLTQNKKVNVWWISGNAYKVSLKEINVLFLSVTLYSLWKHTFQKQKINVLWICRIFLFVHVKCFYMHSTKDSWTSFHISHCFHFEYILIENGKNFPC